MRVSKLLLLVVVVCINVSSALAVPHAWVGRNSSLTTTLYAHPDNTFADAHGGYTADIHQTVLQGTGYSELVIDPNAGVVRYTSYLTGPQAFSNVPNGAPHASYDDEIMNSMVQFEMERELDVSDSFDLGSGELNLNMNIPFEIQMTFYGDDVFQSAATSFAPWRLSADGSFSGYFYTERDSSVAGLPFIYEFAYQTDLEFKGYAPDLHIYSNPEPATSLLLLSALLGGAVRRRNRAHSH